MAKKGSSRVRRAILSSLILLAVAGVLAASNIYSQNRDRTLALGPQGQAQKEFFLTAPDRPDIGAFFKKLKPAEKLAVAKNLHRYDDPDIVRLAAIWLADFDFEARKELTKVLVGLANTQPNALVAELKNKGGFQKIAIFQALQSQRATVLPKVVDALDTGETRANAVDLLVEFGRESAPLLLDKLRSSDKDIRLAAADALGKLAYVPAGPALRELYRHAAPDAQLPYLTALSNLGWAESEPLLKEIFQDPNASAASRSVAALGLGRIGSPTAVRILVEAAHDESGLHDDLISALQLAGDKALAEPTADEQTRLAIAAGIRSARADEVIGRGLSDAQLETDAATLAADRPSLAPALRRRLETLDASKDGKRAATLIDALATTDAGRAVLNDLKARPALAGFIERALIRRR